MVSWNVLAQDYVGYLSHRDSIEPAESRYAKVAAQIKAWAADVILLQEVDWVCLFHLRQQLSGYRIFYGQRPQGKADGLATLVCDHLDVLSTQNRYFKNADGSSGTRLGQSLILSFEGRRILVGNIHFSYDDGPSSSHKGIFEAKQYLGGLPLRMVDGAVIGGDWNAEVEHPLLELALSYGFQDAVPNKKATCRANGQAMAIDHLMCSTTWRSKLWFQPMLEDDRFYPNSEMPSDHLPIGVQLFL